ncbi:Hypothetical protein, putative [Bodo saltans]|uniref:SET domain-containing protein n=1 Tax=Bodo saltans TaxID=75058 RepID=A0A0S4ITS0_BODSA|nr:Hypothetical protein, putative [Bodo saltans]|eukprot:CUF82392.1 Hypothetical protein, putative [Bodo saltans]
MFDVQYIPGAGRGCVATRDLFPGDVVVREEAFVMVPVINGRGSLATCIACFKQFPSVEPHPRCDGCGEHYCSTECQDRYAPVKHHKWDECKVLEICREKRADISVDDFNHLRAMVLLAVRAKMEGFEEVLDTPAPRFKPKIASEVDMVCAKVAEIVIVNAAPLATTTSTPSPAEVENQAGDSSERFPDREPHESQEKVVAELRTSSFAKSIATLTCNVPGFQEDQLEFFQNVSEAYDALQEDHEEFLPVISTHMFVKISCAYQCNGFSLWTADQKRAAEEAGCPTASTSNKDHEVASGFFGYAAMINHSCAPNTLKTFVGREELQFVVTKPVKKGEQLFLCYVDKHLAFNLRQWRLSTQYFFDCRCTRCAQEIAKSKR